MSEPQPRLVVDGTDAAEFERSARALEKAGRLDEAAALLEPLVDHDRATPEVLYRLACVRARQQRVDEAETFLRRAIAGRQEDARFHTNLGVVLDMQGRADEAVRAFRRALQLAPDDPTALLNLGALYGEMGRHDDAARWLGHCLERHPGFDPAFNLAIVVVCLPLIGLIVWFFAGPRGRPARV